jgi:HSP20 family protein
MARILDLFGPVALFGNEPEELIETVSTAPREEAYPAMNAWEADDKVYVEAELPGMMADEVDVRVTGAELRLSGNRKAPNFAGGSQVRQERSCGEFSRTITLLWDIDSLSVSAALSDGILTITMSKAERCKCRKIEVRNA